MDALLIKTDPDTNKLMIALAKKLGAIVHVVKENQYEDILLGNAMDKAKTGHLVTRKEVFAALKAK